MTQRSGNWTHITSRSLPLNQGLVHLHGISASAACKHTIITCCTSVIIEFRVMATRSGIVNSLSCTFVFERSKECCVYSYCYNKLRAGVPISLLHSPSSDRDRKMFLHDHLVQFFQSLLINIWFFFFVVLITD